MVTYVLAGTKSSIQALFIGDKQYMLAILEIYGNAARYSGQCTHPMVQLTTEPK